MESAVKTSSFVTSTRKNAGGARINGVAGNKIVKSQSPGGSERAGKSCAAHYAKGRGRHSSADAHSGSGGDRIHKQSRSIKGGRGGGDAEISDRGSGASVPCAGVDDEHAVRGFLDIEV